jgi:hypothetical protein
MKKKPSVCLQLSSCMIIALGTHVPLVAAPIRHGRRSRSTQTTFRSRGFDDGSLPRDWSHWMLLRRGFDDGSLPRDWSHWMLLRPKTVQLTSQLTIEAGSAAPEGGGV